jgi:hypothetical protein
VLLLSWIWTTVHGSVWGIASLGLAALAYRLARSGGDVEFTHVEATAVVILSLAGTLWLADSVGSRVGQSSALMLGAAAAHAFATLNYLWRSEFIAPQKVAIATVVLCLSLALLSETMFRNFALHGFDIVWTLAELGVIATCLWIWWSRRNSPTGLTGFLGIGSYVALMLIDARILGQIWPPLITASFAIAGAAFLMFARGRHDARVLVYTDRSVDPVVHDRSRPRRDHLARDSFPWMRGSLPVHESSASGAIVEHSSRSRGLTQ